MHPSKKRNQLGQSLIEFTVILTLVMATIITAGSYIIRGWNAQVKGWEDSVIESFEDPQVKGNEDDITIPICDCGPWIGAPPGDCGVGICPPTFWYEYRDCIPLGCADALGIEHERCNENCLCCVYTLGACGGGPGPCPDSKRWQHGECGFGCIEDNCLVDPTCEGACQPESFDPTAEMPWKYLKICDDDVPPPVTDPSWAFVPNEAACSVPQDAIWCEVVCNPPFVPDPPFAPTKCDCPEGMTESSQTCICAPGFFLVGSCDYGAFECRDDTCSLDGQCRTD